MNLSEAELETTVKVVKIRAQGELRRRFFDLGIVEGTNIKVLYESPFKDPRAYYIRGTIIAMRGDESKNIIVDSNL
ncbi:FeoA family protein [Clostridium sp. HCP1S3_B4]|uniref:FeoA family protein n=1 Tax=unclassified Clostridium TaxID=2614128 RepID=UPI00169580AE|nr:FeoA family protein [Clostridiales bacterium]MDY2728614.1 FeoA family protein [Clostridium sp.]NLK23173.1 ferrous iron transport protein A [Clostridiales bacterium]